MLPVMLSEASTAACHPNLPRLSTIRRLEPMDTPSTKSSSKMVSEALFSTFCNICTLRIRYPIPIPINMIDIIVNISFLLLFGKYIG